MRRERERRRGEEGNKKDRPPFVNSWIRPGFRGTLPRLPNGALPLDPTGTSVCQIPSLRPLLHNSWSTPRESPLLWNTAARRWWSPSQLPSRLSAVCNSRQSAVIWRYSMSDTICMLFAQNTVTISSSEWHQCRQNCCQHKPYIYVKYERNPVSAGAPPQTPLAELTVLFFTALPTAPSWI